MTAPFEDEVLHLRIPGGVQALEDQMTYISVAEDPKVGFKGLIGPEWKILGINNQGSAQGLTRNVERSSVSGTGLGVVSYAHTPGDVTGQAEIIDENDVIRWIQWPDTVRVDGVDIKRHTGKAAEAHVLRVNIRQDGIIELEVTRVKAFLTISEQGRGAEAGPKTVDIAYRADEHKAVFESVFFKVEGDVAVQINPKRFVADSEIKTKAQGKDYQIGERDPEEAAGVADARGRVGEES